MKCLICPAAKILDTQRSSFQLSLQMYCPTCVTAHLAKHCLLVCTSAVTSTEGCLLVNGLDAAGVAGYPQNGYGTEQPTGYHRHASAPISPLLPLKIAPEMSALAATLLINALSMAPYKCIANIKQQEYRINVIFCRPDCMLFQRFSGSTLPNVS